ncbi:hypothetical protein EMIHUDRAFT_309300 [Emiliania huxleyi CCMP1516]|uniref:Uncharacterized protein n=2 Tax=Emiliania huxleyi TaxID=2903 RepID=A0A0D3KM13_EMIH1|nr:hypothetical protein EMIHUDRAFT_309300 [Emiliania huxleyi CCMP1516]EOD36798.1 hypothetical protein EMIHUDRAFT_309300 [Emiliania huxleyi CCMP1516]|eukprot:XP_005789227.1 hypothetical protein EMIHUDRAFT_309300 [Emiliania huxleyi CCMP1516]
MQLHWSLIGGLRRLSTSCGEDSEAGGLRRRDGWRRCAYERENHPAQHRVGDNRDQKGDDRDQKGRAM